MLLHSFVPASGANGPGLRSVVFFQGCTLHCPGCWNPSSPGAARPGITTTEMSARLSTGSPRACSGLMYAAVPRITPALVAALIVGESSGLPTAASTGAPRFAKPKSSTLTVPSDLILMLPGFRSRCTIPRSCAASSASAIWRANARASSSGIRPSLMRSARVGPSTSSITR